MASIEGNMGQPQKTSNLASKTAKVQSSASSFRRWGRKYPFIGYGLPMISLTVFGAVGLGHLLQGRNGVGSKGGICFLACKVGQGIQTSYGPIDAFKPKKISLEEELKALRENVDINNYDYKRIPRQNEGKPG
ncbi:hypothetical protein DITRI_Ditri12bG0089100 [Diplodiscus trichospermus]